VRHEKNLCLMSEGKEMDGPVAQTGDLGVDIAQPRKAAVA
jgi:hypothetical protein